MRNPRKKYLIWVFLSLLINMAYYWIYITLTEIKMFCIRTHHTLVNHINVGRNKKSFRIQQKEPQNEGKRLVTRNTVQPSAHPTKKGSKEKWKKKKSHEKHLSLMLAVVSGCTDRYTCVVTQLTSCFNLRAPPEKSVTRKRFNVDIGMHTLSIGSISSLLCHRRSDHKWDGPKRFSSDPKINAAKN